MAYCTITDIKKSIPLANIVELTDDTGDSSDNSVTSAMQSIIDYVIERADSEIDDYCRGRYTLPLFPVPISIKDISVDLAIYKLYSRVKELEFDHPRRQQYDDAIKRLRAINRGEIILNTVPETDGGSVIAVKSNMLSTDRMFSKSELGKY